MQSESLVLEERLSWPHARLLVGARATFLLVTAFGLLYALVARYVLHAFPFAGDEYSVVLQAKLFAHGQLRAPGPAHPDWLGVDHVLVGADWVRSKYPPGMAAIFAVGERFGAMWLVNPLLGVATLLVVRPVIRRALGETAAFVGLVALGLAPLFAFDASSFFSHTASGLFLAIAFVAVASWLERGGAKGKGATGWFVLCGAALGCGFLVRPFDAVLFGVAMLSLRSVPAIVVTAAAAIPFVGISLFYQWEQYGSLLVDGYSLYAPTLGQIYGPRAGGAMLSLGAFFDPLQVWFHIDVLRAFVIDWTVPGAVVLALFGAYAVGKGHPASRLRNFCIALVALSVFALLFTKANPDDGPRPRYLAPILVPLAVLAGAGFAPACAVIDAQFGPLVRKVIVGAALLFGLGQFAAFLQGRVPQMWKREGVFVTAESLGLHDAVVVVRAQYPTQYARNGPWFEGTLFLSPPPSTPAEEIAAAYPDRPVWEAFEGEKWRFVKIR